MIAFVLGSAACVAADLEAAIALVRPDTLVAVNGAAPLWRGPLPHFATMHPEKASLWLTERAGRGLPPPEAIWCPPGIGRLHGLPWRFARAWGGSSGLFGVSVALGELGAHRVILCGVPLDAQPHVGERAPWTDALRYRYAWRARKRELVGKVKSMSGWTRELLGAPTPEWLGLAVSSAPEKAGQH